MASFSQSNMNNKPTVKAPRSLGGRLLGLAAAALVVSLMVYGERWQLHDAPMPTLECAVTASVAHALDERSVAD